MQFGTRPKPKTEGVMHQMTVQQGEPTSRLGWLLSVLAVVIPAGTVYAWRSGMFAEVSGAAPAHANVAQAQPAARPATPVDAGVFTVEDYEWGFIGKRHAFAYDGTLGTSYAAAWKEGISGGQMRDLIEDRDISDLEAYVKAGKTGPNDFAAQCYMDSKRRLNSPGEHAHLRHLAARGQEIHCLLTKKPERLCNDGVRTHLSRRFRAYANVAAYAAAPNNSYPTVNDINGLLNQGIHKMIRQEMTKLAEQKVLRPFDIGATPPKVVSRTMGSVQIMSDGCAGKS